MEPAYLLGRKFSRLLVVKDAGRNKFGNHQWLCRCDCSNEILVITGNLLKRLGTKSCGCLKIERTSKLNLIHGKTRSPEWYSWMAMRWRCSSPKASDYHWYGGRGIKVCKRWKSSFKNFLADMGLKPSPKHTLDRINNDGDYKPSNCKWATMHEQALNRRPKFNHA
jgi:hypothetical protein